MVCLLVEQETQAFQGEFRLLSANRDCNTIPWRHLSYHLPMADWIIVGKCMLSRLICKMLLETCVYVGQSCKIDCLKQPQKSLLQLLNEGKWLIRIQVWNLSKNTHNSSNSQRTFHEGFRVCFGIRFLAMMLPICIWHFTPSI